MRSVYITLSVAVLALSACGKSDTTMTVKDPASGEKVDVTVNKADPGDMTIKSDNGTMVINSGADAKLPSGMIVYPGAEVQSSVNATNSEGVGNMVMLKSKDAPEKILAFYKEKLTASGMKISMETSMPNGGMIIAGGEKDKPGAMVTANAEKGETVISVMMGKQ
jgi:hypothetical protein